MSKKRVSRIEASLTPKQIVLLWLRTEHQGSESGEYARRLLQLPPNAAPRPKIALQVERAIRAAMKGQEAGRVSHAVKQAQMEADFLILLVNRTNTLVLTEAQVRWLKLAVLQERMRWMSLSEEGTKTIQGWVTCMRSVAVEFLAVEAACRLIQAKYFCKEPILLRDATDDLQKTNQSHPAYPEQQVVGDGCRTLFNNTVQPVQIRFHLCIIIPGCDAVEC